MKLGQSDIAVVGESMGDARDVVADALRTALDLIEGERPVEPLLIAEVGSAIDSAFNTLAQLLGSFYWSQSLAKALGDKLEVDHQDATTVMLKAIIPHLVTLQDSVSVKGNPIPPLMKFFQQTFVVNIGTIVKTLALLDAADRQAEDLCGKYGIDFDALKVDEPNAVVAFKKASAAELGLETDAQGRVTMSAEAAALARSMGVPDGFVVVQDGPGVTFSAKPDGLPQNDNTPKSDIHITG